MKNRYKIGQHTALTGMIINIILTLFKLFAGLLAQSTAMIADAVHSASDTLATLVVYIGFAVAKKPNDPGHPYGHDKAEAIAAKILAIILLMAGLSIAWGSFKRILQGNLVLPGAIAIYAAILSIIIKEGLYWYVWTIAKKINSTALKAEAWHHRSDALSSLGTLIGITAARMGIIAADPIAAMLVSILIVRVALNIYKKSIDELMDTAAPVDTVKSINNLILTIEKVKAVDSLKTRIHGNGLYADADILVDHFIPVSDGHKIAKEVEDVVKAEFNQVKDIMVHVNPCNPSMDEYCHRCPHQCQSRLYRNG